MTVWNCTVAGMLQTLGEHALNVLNSNFSSALFGAMAGALIAQRVADKSERRKEQVSEARSSNAAIAPAAAITNTLLDLKGQQVASMVEAYNGHNAAREAHFRELPAEAEPQPFRFEPDLKTLLPVETPKQALLDLLYNKVPATPPILSLAALLTNSLAALNGCIEGRNAIIENLRAEERTHVELARIYFGLPNEAGHVDTRYPDYVKAIGEHTDDGLIFAYALTEQLAALAARTTEALPERLRPVLVHTDLQAVLETGHIPWSDRYQRIFDRLQITVSHSLEAPAEPARA